jgi:hypothetical protein
MEAVGTIAVAVALLVAVGSIVWLVSRAGALTDRLLEARDNAGTNAVAAERARFDADKATQALVGEKARADALQEYISHDAKQTDPAAALAPDDVDGRVLRIAQRWGGANVSGATDQARPGTTGDVHPSAPAEAPGPAVPRP